MRDTPGTPFIVFYTQQKQFLELNKVLQAYTLKALRCRMGLKC